LLVGMIVPVPLKVRLTAARIRLLGTMVADVIGRRFPELSRQVVMNCSYGLATDYTQRIVAYGLSPAGQYKLTTGTVLSRWLGIVELSGANGPLLDVLLDATETRANPAVLALVRRNALPQPGGVVIQVLADQLGGAAIL